MFDSNTDMTAKFHVVYDGSALDEHLMDVRDLAPAMMAVNDLLIHANQEINGDKLKIELKVKANFKAGSFGIEFIEHLAWVNQIRDLLISPNGTALANASGILTLIGFFTSGAAIGVVQVYKVLKGKAPVKIEENIDGAKIFYSETECLEVNKNVLKLYRNKTISADLNKLLDPLTRDGIDSFFVVKDSDKDQVELMISKDEIEYFQYHSTEFDLSENVTETYLNIESVTFREKNKWKLNNGSISFNATILDEEFLQKVNEGVVRFGKNDLLKVHLRIIQTLAHGKLKTDYEIVNVLEHKIATQGLLDL